MRSELHLSDHANMEHLPPTARELYDEMLYISKHRNDETYYLDVGSNDGRLTHYRFKTWSVNILRFISRMSLGYRYILAILLEAEFKQKTIDEVRFYPNKLERPILIRREMSEGRVTFILTLASNKG